MSVVGEWCRGSVFLCRHLETDYGSLVSSEMMFWVTRDGYSSKRFSTVDLLRTPGDNKQYLTQISFVLSLTSEEFLNVSSFRLSAFFFF